MRGEEAHPEEKKSCAFEMGDNAEAEAEAALTTSLRMLYVESLLSSFGERLWQLRAPFFVRRLASRR